MKGEGVGRLRNESERYRALRSQLRDAELELMLQRERVAELRRNLPADTETPDYLLHEGPRDLAEESPEREVRLSELFTDPSRPLVVYHFMYGGAQESPCPSCTMWLDGLNGIAIYTVDAHLKAEHWRGIDLYTPVWHILDVLPEGRGDWNPSLEYLGNG